MNTKLLTTLSLALSGCLTLSGNYKVTGFDENGYEIRIQFTAQGSGIYTVRNAICSSFPKATVIVADLVTGEELKSESPYHCR